MPAPLNNRVFLPRVPAGGTEDVIKAHFSRFGDITDVYIPANPSTGKPKGMAFITFSSEADAASAVEQAEQQINGEACEVLKATPKPDKRGGGGPMRREPDVADPYLAGFLHAQRLMMGGGGPAPAVRQSDPPRLDERPRIFVRDVPDSFEDGTLQRHFEQFGEITDLYQPEYKGVEGRKKKGIAYITYKAAQHVSACLAQGETHSVEGVDLTVSRADPRRVGEKERPAAMPAWAGSGYDMPYVRSRSPPRRPDFGGSGYSGSAGAVPSRAGAQGTRIFAGGIPPDLSSDQVSEHFRKHGGEIADIYFPKDARTGGKRGFCYITFQENLAVHRAVANAPREINGFPIGEVKVAEDRPGQASHGGRGSAPRSDSDRGGRGGDMGGYGYGGGGGSEGRGRGSYDRSSYDDNAMGWAANMMGGAYGAYGADPYGARTADHWSAGGGGYGMGGFGDGMPREGGEMMERMAPLLNLLAGGGSTYGGANSQAGGGYGGGNSGGWGQGGGQGGLGSLQSQGGGYAGQSSGQRGHDNADGRYRPY